jgi:hypothetical protein
MKGEPHMDVMVTLRPNNAAMLRQIALRERQTPRRVAADLIAEALAQRTSTEQQKEPTK